MPRGRFLLALCALVLLIVPAHRADALLGPIHPDVLTAARAVREAQGPEAYAALRELWRTWDRADPVHVEEAIESAAQSPSASPPVRVYADLLSAYARRRRGDLDGAAAKIKKLGFISQWIVVGPFDNENKEGFSRAYGPELDLGQPIPTGRTYDGKERAVRWRVPPEVPEYGWFDFGDLVRPREHACAYASAFVRAKPGTKAPRPVSLWVGSAGAFKVFLDGEQVLQDSAYREFDIDRFATMVTLGTQFSRLTVKVCGDEDAPKFALRIGDTQGAPEHDVEMTIELPAGAATKEQPAASAPEKKAKPNPKPTAKIEGPLQALERAASEPNPTPKALEAYARYLAITRGDARADHKARDLSRRAAEAAPTVPRLLLAGQLAEDRNQQREWAKRAADLVGPAQNDIEVLLFLAQIEQSGTNWRDAVPMYERIVAIDPENVRAILGLVTLYVEAGLKRTALHMLEQAVSRQPGSVGLLGALAAQLRAAGRDTEAAEVESRYAAFRFDDADFLSQKVDLAVARRDPAGAERWLERFLRIESDSAWARGVAARTYRALGQKERALAAYQRALSMAPEDISTLRALADLYGEEDDREKQHDLLRQILVISPQAKDVREYLEHVAPPGPRPDEAYAWAPARFLPMRSAPAQRYPKRTLRQLTVTTVYPNGLASRFKQVVYQPLTDEAAAAARQYSFEYQADRQTVTLRAARVYRADGKVDEAIESGEAGANNPAIAMYTSTRTFYVNFPRLNAGDLVELRYRIEDVALRNEMADYFGEVEYLQSDEPLASSEYVLITPKRRTFYLRPPKLPGLVHDTKENGDQRIIRLLASDVPPIAPEPGMAPWPEMLAHVHVSTFKTWNDVGTWYWGLVREQFDVDDEVRTRTREITKGLTDTQSKVRAVYKFATELRYVALEFGIEGIRPRRTAQTVARGWGDCKDKATLIVTMLRELGIPSTIVLVRTRLRGDIEEDPASLAPFDHAIVYVPSLNLYLDGTAENTGSTELPVMDRGALALQINEGKPQLVHLPQPPAEESAARRRVEVSLGADGSAQFTSDSQVSGAYAPDWRQRYLAEGTRRDRAVRDLATDFGPVELAPGKGAIEVNDLEDIEQPVRLRARGKAESFARLEGDNLSAPAGASQRLVANLASLSQRKLDITLNALTSRDDEWVIRLPAGMKVVRAPVAQQADTPFGKFSVTVEHAQGKVTVRSTIAFKRVRIRAAEYEGWRSFCEAADRAFGQRIVVGK
jgi:tetratricopeptide (TPR) repeat protein